MQKRIYDLQPNAELWSYDYDPNTVYVLAKLTNEQGSRGALVRRIASYWTHEKRWKFTNATSEHGHDDNLVTIREFLPIFQEE